MTSDDPIEADLGPDPGPRASRHSRPPGRSTPSKSARSEFEERGSLKAAQERLKSLEPDARKAYGQRFNGVKQAIEAAFEAAKGRVGRPEVDRGRRDRRDLARHLARGSGIGTR